MSIPGKVGRPNGTFKGFYPTAIGHKPTRAYRKYQSMLARCYQTSHPANAHYKSNGITVCDRWKGKEGFSNYMRDMGEPPEGLTLERIDRTKGYSPDNCRWATWLEQAANRDKGGAKPNPNSIQQKAIAAGLPYNVVYGRIKRLGWAEEKALSEPVEKRNRAKIHS